MSDIEKQYTACLLLGALGDTIGYKNEKAKYDGKYPAKEKIFAKDYNHSDMLLFGFIHEGGLSSINSVKGYLISDDTLMHMATAKALIDNYDTKEELYESFANEYLDSIKGEYTQETRNFGIKTLESLRKLENKRGKLWNKSSQYEKNAGGNGGAMRAMCIGLAFHGKNQLNDLIEVSIESCRITHNNAIAYLGAVTTALFTSYAIQNINIGEWPQKLVELLESDIIDKYIKKSPNYSSYENQFLKDKDTFLNKWQKYIERRFTAGRFLVNDPTMIIPAARSKFFNENFSYKQNDFNPGASGDDVCIIAYDGLMSCNGSWETLVVYTMLHMGDSDTTGSIAAAWYGAFNGLDTMISVDALDTIESHEKLLKYGKKLYEKYGE